MGQPDHLDLSDLDDAERVQVIDLAERLRARKRVAAGDTFAGVVSWLDGRPADDLTPEEAAELDRRKAEDQAGAKRWTLEELGL